MVDLLKEESSCGIKSNDPRKGKDVVQTSQKHRNLCDRHHWSHDRSEERVPLMATLPLFVTHQPKKPRLALWLLITRDLAVVIGLIHKGNDEDQDHGPEDGDDPVRPLPLCLPGDEGGHERTEVRRQDNEARPDVDFAPGRGLVYF